ncbi:MAG TPA: class I SAM-dependent methyltransferase, partial [Pyrinomonadaceae bacterium]|nr:class I SAM-dependent methyltransferase [Pyrinomonadaceae bacterium]
MSTDSQLEELTELRRELESNFARALGVDEEELRAAMPLSAERFSQRVSYARTLRLVREAARAYVPAGARVAVVSKGDEELLKLGGSRRAWHFPQHEDGTYAGHYPATSAAASDHLEHLRRKGARFLLIPSTFRWWLEHYADFARQLEARHKLLHDGPGGLVYELQEPRPEPDYLRKLQSDWHEFGRRDPLWAIMTEREKWTLREFFESGVWEVDRVMSYVESLGLPLARRRALDFGCGVGRLTQALCRHFEECRGVDIAPSMIRLAEKYNRHKRRCRYVLNERDDLRVFADAEFDFIYSALVLQHMRPEVAERYVVELLRVLAPGGLLVFQLPARPEKSQAPGGRQPARPRAPLPPEAFRAQITPAADALTLAPGVQAHVRVRVKNLGRAVWPARGVAEGDDKFRLALGGLWT